MAGHMRDRLLRLFLCLSGLVAFGHVGRTAEPSPGGACTTKGQFLITAGGTQNDQGILFCNGSTWSSLVASRSSGNVGIGTSSPSHLLTIQGNLNSSPYALLEIANSAGGTASYAEMAFSGNQRSYFIGTANSSETATGVPNKFFIWDHKALKYRLVIDSNGNLGIGTIDPQATLDVSGYMRLVKNSAQPAACSASNDGAIALTHVYTLCICKSNSSSWVKASDGLTACKW